MADCKLLKTCIFFSDRMVGMPKTADMVKEKYCQGDNSECARHMVFIACGREKVPSDLFPGQIEKARDILANKK
ncbi:MAG: hypothetical protein NTY14_07305 [Candidatus Omnitrophica bacterium]|nr:hypothetical protein [Candidatus Omnitrophota bacterium]